VKYCVQTPVPPKNKNKNKKPTVSNINMEEETGTLSNCWVQLVKPP
jgi:hypothetical protein